MDEEQLLHAARLALVGRLTRGVMHELNNPLFVVLGLVELVGRDLEPGSKAHERLALALSTGDEIKQLVATVLDVARDDAPGEPELLALDEVAVEAATLARRLALAKEVEVVARVESPATVTGRRQQLRQVFLTLLVLSERAAEGGATVELVVAAEGSEALARLAAEGRAPRDAALELEAAAAIARAHGGSLALDLEGGLRVELRLPLV